MSSTAEELTAQAQSMQETMTFFKVKASKPAVLDQSLHNKYAGQQAANKMADSNTMKSGDMMNKTENANGLFIDVASDNIPDNEFERY